MRIPNYRNFPIDRWVIGVDRHRSAPDLKPIWDERGIRSWYNAREYGFVHPLDDATRYYTKEMAEGEAIIVLTRNPSFIGHVRVYEEQEAIDLNVQELVEWTRVQNEMKKGLSQ